MRNIFCFAALVASISGSLLAHFITFISPESFRADVGLTLLIVVIIGGANIWAGILTTVILMGFSEASRGFSGFKHRALRPPPHGDILPFFPTVFLRCSLA